MSGGEIVSVSGGVAGVEVCYEEALGLAGRLDALGDRVREQGRRTRAVSVDPDLLESALLAPTSAAEAEAAVLAAAAAVAAAALGLETTAVGVRSAIGSLHAADGASAAAVQLLDYALVRTATTALLGSGPAVLGGALLARADPALAERAEAAGQELLTDHPGLVQHLADGGGGLVDGLRDPLTPWVVTPTTAAGAATLASAYARGRVTVRPYPSSAASSPPSTVRGLVANLQEVALLSQGSDSPGNGTIAVQTLTSAAGRRHVVYLPGTDEFETPSQQDEDVRDLGTNLRLVAGEPDDYTQGIREALRDAGVRPGEPVLLVGHSQGGMAAAALAAHPGDLHITDVVTAGSPIAGVGGFPDGTHVLSLEQRGDVVPQLDGAANPDSREQTTVVFDAHPRSGVVAHHAYSTYLTGAGLADSTSAPSVVADVDSLHHHGYLTGATPGTTVTTHVLQITR